MKEHEKSRVWLFGDNVNTDLMSPGTLGIWSGARLRNIFWSTIRDLPRRSGKGYHRCGG